MRFLENAVRIPTLYPERSTEAVRFGSGQHVAGRGLRSFGQQRLPSDRPLSGSQFAPDRAIVLPRRRIGHGGHRGAKLASVVRRGPLRLERGVGHTLRQSRPPVRPDRAVGWEITAPISGPLRCEREARAWRLSLKLTIDQTINTAPVQSVIIIRISQDRPRRVRVVAATGGKPGLVMIGHKATQPSDFSQNFNPFPGTAKKDPISGMDADKGKRKGKSKILIFPQARQRYSTAVAAATRLSSIRRLGSQQSRGTRVSSGALRAKGTSPTIHRWVQRGGMIVKPRQRRTSASSVEPQTPCSAGSQNSVVPAGTFGAPSPIFPTMNRGAIVGRRRGSEIQIGSGRSRRAGSGQL
jgi:hypothetical protein